MRKFFAAIFFITLVFPLLFGVMTSVSVITWTLDRDFYINTLNQPDVVAALNTEPFIDQILQSQLHLPPDAETDALEEILQSILTADYMKAQVSGFVHDLFDTMQGKTSDFSPTIDLTPIKTALSGKNQDAFLIALLEALPECVPGQTPGFGSETQSACKPAGVPDALIIEQGLKPALPVVLAQIPDEFPLERELTVSDDDLSWRRFIPGTATPASIMLGMLVLSFIALVVWYLIALVADAGWHGRLQWLGWMLLIPAFSVFLLGFGTQSGLAGFWINVGLSRAQLANTPFSPAMVEIIETAAFAALPRIANAFKMVGGISGAFGLALIFWGIATPRNK